MCPTLFRVHATLYYKIKRQTHSEKAMDFIERLKKEDTEEEEKEIQAAKQLFCEAFNLVYGGDLKISADENNYFTV